MVDRRLTTTAAADVATFSRRVAADEKTTLRALAAHRAGPIDPLLSERGERIAEPEGDSMPRMHEGAVSAMRRVVAVRTGMAGRLCAGHGAGRRHPPPR